MAGECKPGCASRCGAYKSEGEWCPHESHACTCGAASPEPVAQRVCDACGWTTRIVVKREDGVCPRCLGPVRLKGPVASEPDDGDCEPGEVLTLADALAGPVASEAPEGGGADRWDALCRAELASPPPASQVAPEGGAATIELPPPRSTADVFKSPWSEPVALKCADAELAKLRAFVEALRRHRAGECDGLTPGDCLDTIWNMLDGLEMYLASPPPASPDVDLAAAIERAGFRVAKNIAHPFLGPTPEDQPTLWCKECGRDSGYHWRTCSKAASPEYIEAVLNETRSR